MKFQEEFKNRLKINEPLADYTTFKIGGLADLFLETKNKKDLIKAVQLAKKEEIPLFILGGGSKILVSDKGFRGLVIRNLTDKVKISAYRGRVLAGRIEKEIFLEAESGAYLNRLVRFSLAEELSGLESFLGLPGTVGGAIFNNAHFQDKLIGDLVAEVEVLDEQGKVKKMKKNELHFGYDESIFQHKKLTLLSVLFILGKSKKEELWQKANSALLFRKTKQPLNLPSAGCIFRNISKADAIRIGTPNFTTSTGFLIESIGFKGKRIGGAQVSSIHANFIVNVGGAKSSDVIELIRQIKDKIELRFSIKLEEEIVYLGEF